MKKNIIGLCLLIYATFANAQKPPLNNLVYQTWPQFEGQYISNNGRYITYSVGSKNSGFTLFIQAINGSWKRQIESISPITSLITEDSRNLIFMQNDSLGFLELGKDSIRFVPNVNSFKAPKNGNGEWIAFDLKNPRGELVLKNIITGVERKFQSVSEFIFNNDGQVLVLLSSLENDSTKSSCALWTNLSDNKTTTIWKGYKAFNLNFSADGNQLAFISENYKDKNDDRDLWFYRNGMDSAVVRVTSKTSGMEGVTISNDYPYFNSPIFSKDGQQIFFSVKKLTGLMSKASSDTTVQLDVWNYKDMRLQSVQLGQLKYEQNRSYLSVVNIQEDNKVIRLQQEGDGAVIEFSESGNWDHVLLSSEKLSLIENYWNKSSSPKYYLISTKDGSRKLINKSPIKVYKMNFSFGGKYVIWFDLLRKNWFTYNTENDCIENVSKGITVPLYNDQNDIPNLPGEIGIAGWLENDSAVLIYDRYDIWLVDPDGKHPAINITEGYGRKNKIIFRYIDLNKENGIQSPVQLNDILLLSAFNCTNKDNGFFKVNLGPKRYLERLSLGPFAYFFYANYFDINTSPLNSPIKAKNASVYLLTRTNANTYPNLFTTIDFRKFTPQTNLFPEKNYNWYTNELIHWIMFDGKQAEGILYKPENFNPRLKYPVIFYFYEKFSDNLNLFINPGLSNSVINIPLFVSNGYLVFVPNVYYKVGSPGESIYNSVGSAAQYLAKLPFVDASKMGVQGHSFGGYETNYLITRTNLFSAAVSAAGVSDLISNTFSIYPKSGISAQFKSEIGQYRIGATLWAKPALYIKNSPVFFANKVTTPLLIMHNKNDGQVPWSQGLEWFTALNRLGKKVWMLQYDGEGHIIQQERNQYDYSFRIMQFFDHYLKGKPAPKWMTMGITADLKGIDKGLELDIKNGNLE